MEVFLPRCENDFIDMKVCACVSKLSILKDACENIVLVIGVGLAKLNQMKCSCVYFWVMVHFAYLNSSYFIACTLAGPRCCGNSMNS
jgi:hypothetical protein